MRAFISADESKVAPTVAPPAPLLERACHAEVLDPVFGY
jgi:hypothetical protein